MTDHAAAAPAPRSFNATSAERWTLAQRGVARGVLSSEGERTFAIPRFVLPLLGSPRLLAIPARFLSFGLRPPHVEAGKETTVRAEDESSCEPASRE